MNAIKSTWSRSSRATAVLSVLLFATLLPHAGRAASAFKVTIPSDGIYSVSSLNIATNFGVAETQVVSWLQGRQIAVDSLGRTVPAIYGSNSISFFAAGYESRYAVLNTYWIRNASGLEMTSVSSSPSTVMSGQTFPAEKKTEQNININTDIIFDQNEDPWFWSRLIPSQTIGKTLTSSGLGLPGVSSGEKIIVRMMPYNTAGISNVINVAINNALNSVTVGTFVVNGSSSVTWTGNLSSVLLTPSNNTVKITATLPSGQSAYVDWFTIQYRRFFTAVSNELVFTSSSNSPVTVAGFTSSTIEVFDVSNPINTKRVTGLTLGGSSGNYSASFLPSNPSARYVAVSGGQRRFPSQLIIDNPSSLRAPSNGSDFMAISFPAFSNSAQQLVNYRSTRGLSSRLVDLQDIYDEFNYGIPDPRAIRAFLGYAYYSWAVSPRYVAFIGEGSLDYLNFQGFGDCLIPPLVAADNTFGLQASDQPMGDFNTDGSAEVAIGRLPISNSNEFGIIYSKIQAYELGGNWKTQLLCVADVSGGAGNFESDNETAVVTNTYLTHSVERNYIGQQSGIPEAHSNLISSLNKGRGFVSYFGHGNEVKLTENLGFLEKSHVVSLTNAGKPSLLIAMTCLAGDFGSPGQDSLGEAVMVSTNGGTAVWAAGKQQFPADGRELASVFTSNMFMKGTARVGDGIIAATAANSTRVIACQSYNLLGDPALAAGNMYASRPGPLFPSSGLSDYDDWKEIAMAPVVIDQGVGIGQDEDADGDGIKNKDEFIAGTDPLDSLSKLVITYVSKPGSTQNHVKWNSSTRKKYDLERTTNIITGSYQPVVLDVDATPSINSYTDNVGTASAYYFYRVRAK